MQKWEIPELLSENRLDSHAILDEDTISLNGRWRFLCVKGSEPLPDRFYEPTFSSKHWDLINVPSSWEQAGYSQGFFCGGRANPALSRRDKKTPSIDPSNNLVGIYRKRFQINDMGKGRKFVLRFHDVRSAFCVWLNGNYIGMSKGAQTSVSFHVSDVVQAGYNYICVQVSQFSDASYLDTPGMWALSGIIGDVDLYALPHQRITDLYARADFGEDLSDARLRVALTAENADGMTARIAVMDEDKVCYYGEGMIADGKTDVFIPCKNVRLWSADTPHLYKIAVILWDGVAICHTRQIRFGFRKIQIEGTSLLLNDQPLTIKGVCYPHTDAAHYESDIRLMKACNINAVRVFPPVSRGFYEVCDRHGLYVLDDCASDPKNPIRSDLSQMRAEEMIRSHRNYPCIILWNTSAPREFITQLDQTRPHCQDDFYCVTNPTLERVAQMERLEDLVDAPTGLARVISSPTITPADSYRSMPLLALRYGEASGNAARKLIDYADIFRKSQHWSGGFFWNFADQGLFGCSDPACAEGLVTKDRSPHHIYYELQKAYQWIRCQRNEDGSICIKNHYPNRWTQEFRCVYEITRDGQVIDSDILELNIPPRGAQTIRIPMPDSMYLAGRYHLSIRFREAASQDDLSGTAAYFQWELANNPHVNEVYPGGVIRDDGNTIFLKAENITYQLNRATGNLDQILIDDKPLLSSGITPAFYRVRTDAELSINKRLDDWGKMTLKNQFPKPSVVEVNHMSHQVTVMQSVGSGLMRRYQLNRDGSLTVEMRLRTGKYPPNRVGMQGSLPKSFDKITWLGTGPWDTYQDRKGYGEFGFHHQSVSQQEKFLRGQEHGNKTDVFQLKLSDHLENTILFKSDEAMECSVLPYSLSDMENNVLDHSATVFHIDCRQNGLNSVSIAPHSTYTYSFTICPGNGFNAQNDQ